MKFSSAAIIPTNNPERIKECLFFLLKQTMPFERIIIVPWGQDHEQKNEVITRAKNIINNVEIVVPAGDERPESNLNCAIRYLSRDPTDRVAFLNDDVFLDEKWHETVQDAAKNDGNRVSHATLVVFRSSPNLVQSAGHLLFNTRPHDLAYKKGFNELSMERDPLGPCGNSAFIPWNAIEEILRNEEVWDPNFEHWQSCLDFGLKLQLCGCKCHLVMSARCVHEGYLDKSLNGMRLKENHIKKQLRSRLLLYGKFYPDEDRKEAIMILERSLNRWLIEGYPHGEPEIKADRLKTLFECARKESEALLGKISGVWLEMVICLDAQSRRKLLFGDI
jgi:GT2 family glycosyltransferase